MATRICYPWPRSRSKPVYVLTDASVAPAPYYDVWLRDPNRGPEDLAKCCFRQGRKYLYQLVIVEEHSPGVLIARWKKQTKGET